MRRELGCKSLNLFLDSKTIVALGGPDEQNSRYYVASATTGNLAAEPALSLPMSIEDRMRSHALRSVIYGRNGRRKERQYRNRRRYLRAIKKDRRDVRRQFSCKREPVYDQDTFAESAEAPVGSQYRVAVVLPIEDAKELGRIVLNMIAEIESEAGAKR
jgi:hypothetical protein